MTKTTQQIPQAHSKQAAFDASCALTHAAFSTASSPALTHAAFSTTSTKRAGHKKRSQILKLAVVLLVALIGFSTLAFLSTLTNTETNVFGIGKTEISIDENFNGWQTKEVRLGITTDADDVASIVRVMLVPYVIDTDGNYIICDMADFSAPLNNKMDLGDVILEFDPSWSSNWIYGDDGYFYYRYVLYPETNYNQTSLLLTKVSLSEAAQEKYGTDAQIKVELLADALQAEGNAPALWGLSADVASGTVSKL
jgi:hypothetical protein